MTRPMLWGALALPVLGVALGVVWLLRRRSRADEPLVSFVVLLRQPRQLDERALAAAATRAFGTDMTAQGEDATDFAAGEAPHFIVKRGGLFLTVHCLPTPYFDDAEALAEQVGELRRRKALRDHRAWMSVDLINRGDDVALAEARRLMARLVAEMLDDDCLALYVPQTEHLHVVHPGLARALLADDPLQAIADAMPVPVIPVANDDPRLRQAVAEARRRWPEFAAAFQRREPAQPFAVKAPFGDPDDAEFMWLSVTRIEGDTIHGILENDPVSAQGIQGGDAVAVRAGDLNDWLYREGEAWHGGFTVEVLAELERERQQRARE